MFDIEAKKAKIAELERQVSEPGFWDDREAAQKVLQRVSQIKADVERWEKARAEAEDLAVLLELGLEEGDESVEKEVRQGMKSLTKAVTGLELAHLLGGEYDRANAILSIHPGAGGTESQDWAEMLLRMYLRWAERRGYKAEITDFLPGEEAGLKSVTVLISGENAYGYLKAERGIHRLVRISPFDANARRHTSFASVDVIPEVPEDVDIEIRPEDLKIDTYRSGGAGGQYVNKTESAVRITHIPTGIVVACQNERSQYQNREVAMRILKARLFEHYKAEQEKKIGELRGEQKDIAWGNQIRSYVFQPYTMVKDHRTGLETGNVQAVMDGEIDEFIEAYLRATARASA
ncbi:MAG: peptide chain release factor 2 [Firmicutes bacterium]|nr:peptide chain release factor 2 [Bacillota bacterium]